MEIVEFVSAQWVLVSVLIVLIALYFWTEKLKSGTGISVHTATRLINSGEAVVVDIREAAEFKAGHIINAVGIPHNKFKDGVEQLLRHKTKKIIVVDKLGAHAGAIGRTLRSNGFDVSRLDGGMNEWQNQKLPVVKK